MIDQQNSTSRVFIADRSMVTADAIASIIQSAEGLKCVGQTSDVNDIGRELTERNPDVLLLDPGNQTDAWLDRIIEANGIDKPFGIVLFVSRHVQVAQSLKPLIDDFLYKGCSREELVETVRAVGAKRNGGSG